MKPIRIGSFVRALSPFPLPSPSPGDDPLPHGRVEFIERYTDEWGTRTFIGVRWFDGPHIPSRDITRHSPHLRRLTRRGVRSGNRILTCRPKTR